MTLSGSSLVMPACSKAFARQIEPAEAGIFIDVAQMLVNCSARPR